jgi:hypothetical protein
LSDTNDDFAASLAAAAALEPTESDDEPGTPETDDTTDGVEEPDGASDADDSSSADSGDDSEEDESEDSGEASDDVDAIRQKFVDGDVDEALKSLGLDPKILEVNGPKLKAMREGLKAAKELDINATIKLQAAKEAEEKAASLYEAGKKELGPVLKLQRLLGKGDFMAAKDLLEALAPKGTTYKQIAEGIAAAARGMSPAEELYRRRLREMDEEEQRKKDAETEAAKKATEPDPAVLAQKNLDGAKALLAKTAFADIPGAPEALVALAAKNWDPVKKGLKVPKDQLVKLLEKDPVVGGLLELKRLKAGKPGTKGKTPEPEVKRDPKGRFRERPRAESKLTPEQQREARKAQDFKNSVAEAAAMERRERRAAGAGKGRR